VLLLAAPCGAGTLVLRGGKHVEAAAARVAGGMVVVTLASGKHVGYPVAMVDEPATARANPSNPGFIVRPPPPTPRPSYHPPEEQITRTVTLREKRLVLEGEAPPPATVAAPQPEATPAPAPRSPAVPVPGGSDLTAPPILGSDRPSGPDMRGWPPEAREIAAEQPERAAAIAFFDRQCRRLREVADEMEEKLRAWDGACQGTSTTGGVWVQGIDGQIAWIEGLTIDNASTPYCRQLLVEARAAADTIRTHMPEAFNIGRRMGLLPGDVRTATHKYRLDSRLWE